MNLRILVIDDEPDACEILSDLMVRSGHEVATAHDGLTGLQHFHARDFDLVITDIRMPDMDGLELLKQIKLVEKSPAQVIVVTGHGDMENAIRALKLGAYDYLLKPIDVRELTISVERFSNLLALQKKYIVLKENFEESVALQTENLRGQAERIQTAFLEEIGLDGLRVYSSAMREIVNQAERYAQDRQIPVLIQGESGTGKELIAGSYTILVKRPPWNRLLPSIAAPSRRNCSKVSCLATSQGHLLALCPKAGKGNSKRRAGELFSWTRLQRSRLRTR